MKFSSGKIMSHNFHPWEGGEGKIPAQYRIALIQLAKAEISKAGFGAGMASENEEFHRKKAISLLQQALVRPLPCGHHEACCSIQGTGYGTQWGE